MKRVLLTSLLFIGCVGKHYDGKLILDVRADRAFDTKISAQVALNRWVSCGYRSSIPNTIYISEADLNANKPANGKITCANGQVGGNRIVLDSNRCLDERENVIGHEVLHLIGFMHDSDEDYCNFNKILAACGFDISRSGPEDCRDF